MESVERSGRGSTSVLEWLGCLWMISVISSSRAGEASAVTARGKGMWARRQ